jgi:hypothetical protein
MPVFIKPITDAPERTLKYRLHSHLNQVQEGRPYHRIHASALTREDPEFCPREYVIASLTKTKPQSETIVTALAVTFEIGRMVQDQVINWFADMGLAVGDWRCLACARLHTFAKRPVKCGLCGCRAFKPEEHRFESAFSGASCGIDMMVDLGRPRHTIVEIKTIRPEDFGVLAAPLAEHRERTNLYLRLIAESDTPESNLVDTARAKVLYVSKGGYGKQDKQLGAWGLGEQFSPFKEFDVNRDDQGSQPYWERAKMIHDFRNGTEGIPMGVCPTMLCKRAKQCPVRHACFSGQFPAGAAA